MREAQSGGKTFFYKDWVTNFRMPKSTFKYICRELEKEIEKNDTVMRLSIPIKMRVICHSGFWPQMQNTKQLGICLEYLGHQYV